MNFKEGGESHEKIGFSVYMLRIFRIAGAATTPDGMPAEDCATRMGSDN